MNQDKLIQKIINEVVLKYPEFKGVKPGFKWEKTPHDDDYSCILTFKTQVKTATGKMMPLWLKVVGSANGKIKKITGSK